LDKDNRASLVTGRAVDHFFDYVAANNPVPKNHISSVLLAHSISAFIGAAIISLLWILFRPNKIRLSRHRDYGRARQLLSRYSSSSEDYFKLWPADKYFYWSSFQPGFVAYQIIGSTAFGLADPIGPDKAALITEFRQWCRARRLKTCFLPVYEDSLKLYRNAGLELMQIGSSAEIRIEDFLATTVKDKWWRWQLNRAKKSGYTYSRSAPPHSDVLLRQFKSVSDGWLGISGHSERGFALGYYSQQYLQQCVVHYLAEASGKVAAFTNELPQFNASKKMTVDLLRYVPEANNSMPFLLCNVIRAAQDQPDIQIFDLGFVPFAKASGPLLAIAKAFSRDRFSSRGLEQFKNKFKPDWRPNYMAYDGDIADLAIIALNIEKLIEHK
jgi:phosphatidylglycerol lysyltransferase